MAKLSGIWTLEIIDNQAGWKQRIVLQDTAAHDGAYEMTTGDKLPNVSGKSFSITPQSFDPIQNVWVDSIVEEKANWKNGSGLAVMLFCDDNPLAADGDFDDLVVQCKAEDKKLISPFKGKVRRDLSVPEKFVIFEPQGSKLLGAPR
jgi:hypothetical protein